MKENYNISDAPEELSKLINKDVNKYQEIENIIKKIEVSTILFFDMDGTLIDTDFANFLSYKKAIEFVLKSNCNLTYNPNERFNRTNLKNKMPNLSDENLEKIIKQKEKYFTYFLSETKLNVVLKDILLKYSKTNIAVLVTNCRKDRALCTLNYHGIKDNFSNFFFRDVNTNNEKINKFQNAIKNLKISPDLIVAFENERSEIQDAIEAGIDENNILKI